jgi:hypothetical protein
MENILKFNEWILSEAIKTPHLNDRIRERIMENPEIVLPPSIASNFTDEQLEKISGMAKERILKEIDKRIERLSRIDFKPEIMTAYPLMSIFVEYMDKKYPLNLKVEGERGMIGDSIEYFGNQIYVPISLNTLRTIKIYKDGMTEDELDWKNRWHFSNNPDISTKKDKANLRYEETTQGEDYPYIMVLTPSGTVRDFGEKQTIGKKELIQGKSNKPSAYRLSEGRPIRWKTKNPNWAFPGGFATGVIEKVENDYIDKTGKEPKRKIKGDRVILSVIMKDPKGGPDFKTKKDFGFGDEIYLIPPKSKKFSRLEIVKPTFISPADLKDSIAVNCKEAY